MFISTLSPRTQFTIDYSIIQTYLDRHIEPHPFALLSQESISITASCNPDTITIDEDISQSDRVEFIKYMHKELDDNISRKH